MEGVEPTPPEDFPNLFPSFNTEPLAVKGLALYRSAGWDLPARGALWLLLPPLFTPGEAGSTDPRGRLPTAPI